MQGGDFAIIWQSQLKLIDTYLHFHQLVESASVKQK